MNILIIVKSTGENFIRHYYPALPSFRVRYNTDTALLEIENYRPDLVLFEWADSLCANVTNHPEFRKLREKHGFQTVVRIHDHEVTRHDQIFRNVNWRLVDAAWFINPAIQRLFHSRHNGNVPSFFVPNAVDPARFPEQELSPIRRRAGLLSIHFRPRKRIDRVVLLAKELPDWSFVVRVHVPSEKEAARPGSAYREFRKEFERVWDIASAFFGDPKHAGERDLIWPNFRIEHRNAFDLEMNQYGFDDLAEWHSRNDVILSTSDHEGFHYAPAEGALCNAMPVVWNWPTSDAFWEPFIVSSLAGAMARIRSFEPSGFYREYVTKNYSPDVLAPVLLEKIESVMTKV